MNKRYGYITIVAAVTVVAVLVTASSLPGYIVEKGDLYEPFEYAQMYLNDEPYSKLIIEYDHVPGYQPSYIAMERLEEIITNYTNKTVIHIVDDEISFRHTRRVYNKEHVFELSDTYKDHERGGDTMVLHVMYLDGRWEEQNVIGLSYRGDRIVIFMETIINIADRSDNLEPHQIESAVLIHEFGHLLSLVGIGYDSEHEDEDNKHHCDESAGRCVMNADVEVRMGRYTEEPPIVFCELCEQDIEYIRQMERSGGVEERITALVIIGIMAVGIGWIVILIPKKEVKEEEYSIYNDHYGNDTRR